MVCRSVGIKVLGYSGIQKRWYVGMIVSWNVVTLLRCYVVMLIFDEMVC